MGTVYHIVTKMFNYKKKIIPMHSNAKLGRPRFREAHNNTVCNVEARKEGNSHKQCSSG